MLYSGTCVAYAWHGLAQSREGIIIINIINLLVLLITGQNTKENKLYNMYIKQQQYVYNMYSK